METFDEVITQSTIGFMEKAKEDGKPFFVWMNPTRAHVLTHLSPKYDAMRNPETANSDARRSSASSSFRFERLPR
jgi:arylsulfatase